MRRICARSAPLQSKFEFHCPQGGFLFSPSANRPGVMQRLFPGVNGSRATSKFTASCAVRLGFGNQRKPVLTELPRKTYPRDFPQPRFSTVQLCRSFHATPRPRNAGGLSPYRSSAMTPKRSVQALLLANAGVFLMWQQAGSDVELRYWMQDNFVVSLSNIAQGRLHTLVTNAFSHAHVMHFLFNGLMFYFMAPPVAAFLGTPRFVMFYLSAGIFTSLAHIMWTALKDGKIDLIRNNQGGVVGVRTQTGNKAGAMGMSGVVLATAVFFAGLYPRQTLLLYGVVPVPAWAFATGIIALEAYGTFGRSPFGDNVSHSGHLGGALFGLLCYVAIRYRYRRFM